MTLEPGSYFGANVTYPTQDGAIYVFDACAEPLTCLAGADFTRRGGHELVAYTNSSPVTKTVYLVIDSYGSNTCGDFTCSFECYPGTVGVEPMNWGHVKSLFR